MRRADDPWGANVRFGSKADIGRLLDHVVGAGEQGLRHR